jgi:hypothetical protein
MTGEAQEAIGEAEVAVLGLGDFEAVGEFRLEGEEGRTVGADGLVEAGGEQAAFEAGGAEHGLLADGELLEGVEFLGIDRLIGGNEVGAEASDFIDVFEADDGEAGGGEAVLGGVAGGAGLAVLGGWSGRFGRIGAVGGELLFGDGLFTGGLLRFGFRHGNVLSPHT